MGIYMGTSGNNMDIWTDLQATFKQQKGKSFRDLGHTPVPFNILLSTLDTRPQTD